MYPRDRLEDPSAPTSYFTAGASGGGKLTMEKHSTQIFVGNLSRGTHRLELTVLNGLGDESTDVVTVNVRSDRSF
jgi:hypothetical protein